MPRLHPRSDTRKWAVTFTLKYHLHVHSLSFQATVEPSWLAVGYSHKGRNAKGKPNQVRHTCGNPGTK